MAGLRTVRIAAPDDSLLRALAEHRQGGDGWRFLPVDGAPEPDELVILDFDEAEMRCRSIKEIRDAGFPGPVLILGARADERDGAWSLEDELIRRPVRLGTLLARIDTHWAESQDTGAIMLGPYEFAAADRILRHIAIGDTIRLTELERKLLTYLAEMEGGLVDRPQLLLRVWGYSAGVDTHTVETHIWRLRQKIETDDPATHFLVTETGGYRLALSPAQERTGMAITEKN